MEISKITIASEYWNKEDLDEISNVFSQKIERRKVERWAQESLDPALIIIITFIGSGILTGILNAIGQDIWQKLKQKITNQVSNKNYPGLSMSFENEDSKFEFDLRSNDPKIIERGFDSMNEALKTIENTHGRINFIFDITKQKWEKLEERKIVKIISGILAGSDTPIVKDGKTFVLRDEDLVQIAKMNYGIPFTLGHSGKIIGKVIKTWVDGKIVRFEAGIFEGLSEEESKQVDEFKGASMGFTRPED